MSAEDGPERPEAGDPHGGLPAPTRRRDMLLSDHRLDDGCDWVEIRLSLPVDTYEMFERAASGNLVSAAELLEDLICEAGAPKKNGGYLTGVMLDFPRIPDGVASNPEEYR